MRRTTARCSCPAVDRGARPDPRVLPPSPGHPVRAGADRRPPPRAPRQRALHLGHRAGDGRPGRPADRGPRPPAVAAGVRGGAARRPRAPRSRPRRAGDRRVPGGPDAVPPVRRRVRVYEAALDRLRDARARLRLRLLAVDVRGVRGGARPAVARDRAVPAAAASWHSPRTRARACGWPSGRARSAGWTCWRGRWPTSRRRPATSLVRDRVGNWTYALLRGRRRHAPRHRPRDPRPRPARRDARPAAAGAAARSRDAAVVPPPPAGPPRRPARSSRSPRATPPSARCSTPGRTPADLFGLAARLAGLRDDATPIEPADLGSAVRGRVDLASGRVRRSPSPDPCARGQASMPPSGRTIQATLGLGPANSRQRTECSPVSTADDGNAPGSAYGRTVCVAKIPPGSRM